MMQIIPRTAAFLFAVSLITGFALVVIPEASLSQSAVEALPDTTICAGAQVTLTATVLTGAPTALTLTDDQWSGVIPLPFPFTFYGNVYNQCIIGSNNEIGFNTANAGLYNTWPISNALPSATPADLHNCVMGPWQDLLPPSGGTIKYATVGTAPNRVFVADYCNVAMFQCTSLTYSSQLQLKENGNIVETHILNKPVCTTWNGGYAIHGLQDATGTFADIVPGRNYPSQWTTANEGYRFTPNGPNSYTITPIPFAPAILANPTVTWYVNGSVVGTGPTLTVTPLVNTSYVAQVVSACGNVTFSDTATVTVSPPPSLIVTPSNPIICTGVSVNLTASGATTYSWAPPTGLSATTGATVTANPAVTTTYTVSGSNGGGCTVTGNATVTVSSVNAGLTQTNVLCAGSSNGTATATPTGGTSPYIYSWSNAQTGAVATGLAGGSYSVTVTDLNGCTATGSVTITVPVALSASITPVNNVMCAGGSNGSATASGTGGDTPYSYSWSDAETTATATHLTAGSFTVTVTDVNGCTATANIAITQPAPMAVVISGTVNGTCNGGTTGSATATASNGTSPFTYLWSNSETLQTATGLAAGTYTVTATDANGCTITTTATINQPTPLVVSVNNTNVSCNGGNTGTATVAASGSNPPYTYLWSNAQTGATATGLAAGTFQVTVTDASNCTATGSATVTEPQPITVSMSETDASCAGHTDGSATANPSGGTPAYSFSWNTTPVQNGLTANNITIGNYSVTVTDASNCTVTGSISVGSLTALSVNITSSVNELCAGGNNGSASANATGGSGTFTYAWSSTPVQTTQNATGLTAGTYTVTATDAGCVRSGIELVSNGDFSAGNTGFSSSYTYQNPNSVEGQYWVAPGSQVNGWNGGMNSNGDHTTGSGNLMIVNGAGTPNSNVWCQTITVLPNTTYLFSTWVSSLNNSNPALLQFSINGVNLGSIFNAPATWGSWIQFFTSWSSGASTSASICVVNQNTTLSGNDFGLDDISFQQCIAGCSVTTTTTITEPAPLTLHIDTTNVSCNGGSNGTATATVTGGTAPYSYQWSNGQTSAVATNLASGAYSVAVTDFNNCTITLPCTINQPTPLTASDTNTPVSCNGGNNGTATVTPSGGTTPYTYSWTNGETVPTDTNLIAGSYTVTVTDFNTCTITASTTVTEPTALSVSTTFTNAVCFGSSDGTASATATGGVPGYTFLWSDGQTVSNATGLAAGNYIVTVTDMNSCTATTPTVISQPPGLVPSVTSTDALCFQSCNGQAVVTSTGGTGQPIYQWNDPAMQTTDTAFTLCAGSYFVTLTDASGCTAIDSVTIGQPTVLTASIAATDTICIGQSDILNVTAIGSVPPYSYLWTSVPVDATLTSTTSQNPTVSPTITTIYSVGVTDANGCTVTSSFTLNVRDSLHITVSAIGPVSICPGDSTSISFLATGGDNIYHYTYSGGAGTITSPFTVTPPATMLYTFMVNDACGTPADSDTVRVTVNPLPVVDFSGVPVEGCVPLQVAFNYNLPAAGNTFLWNFGDTASAGNNTASDSSSIHNFFNPGLYGIELTVTNSFGCIDSLKKPDYITVHSLPVAGFTFDPAYPGLLSSEINFSDMSTGANAWAWNFGDGFNSTHQNPIHVYTDTGSYFILLTVENQYSCIDTISHSIYVHPEFTLYVPTGFTPGNKDGINDVFKSKGGAFLPDNFSMTIFNRWGEQLFFTGDSNEGWDGTYKGALLEQGVYLWVIVVTDNLLRDRKFTGHVTLVR